MAHKRAVDGHEPAAKRRNADNQGVLAFLHKYVSGKSDAELLGIRQLNLCDRPIRALPAGIASLTRLAVLNLSGCPLRALPVDIAALQCLGVLFLSRCPLQALPTSIAALKNLWWIDLSMCPLQELPAGIGALTNLAGLSLSGCSALRRAPPALVARLPAAFSCYTIGTPCLSTAQEIAFKELHRDSALFFSALPADILFHCLPPFVGELVQLAPKTATPAE